MTLDENNPVYDIIRQFKILLSYGNNFSVPELNRELRLVSLCKTIFSSPPITAGFFYALRKGAFSMYSLMVDLELAENTAYRVVRDMRKLGIVDSVTYIKKGRFSRGGPRFVLYGILGVTQEQISQGIRDHNRAQSPKYRVAEVIAQSVLKNFLEPRGQVEITYRDLLILVREKKGRYTALDMAELATVSLQDKGIKVWR